MTAYFVTGATGFIGRHLVERLLEREGDIHVLVREGSRDKLEAQFGNEDRVKPVIGDILEPNLGVDPSELGTSAASSTPEAIATREAARARSRAAWSTSIGSTRNAARSPTLPATEVS